MSPTVGEIFAANDSQAIPASREESAGRWKIRTPPTNPIICTVSGLRRLPVRPRCACHGPKESDRMHNIVNAPTSTTKALRVLLPSFNYDWTGRSSSSREVAYTILWGLLAKIRSVWVNTAHFPQRILTFAPRQIISCTTHQLIKISPERGAE